LAYPKNLTIRFRARRTFIYGGTSPVKTTSLTAASKDPVGESPARDLKGMPVHLKILDEEFLEYHALLDNM
jgi:hypothetical protein